MNREETQRGFVMGGNALSKPSVRLDDVEYESVSNHVLEILEAKGYSPYIIKAYAEKDSYGDMDILFDSEKFNPFEVAEFLEATEIIRNGSVTSIGFPMTNSRGDYLLFQIDLIKVSNLQAAAYYFDYNDLGNLMGKIAHKMGFKYGHEGMKYVIRDDEDSNHVIDEIFVSTDHREIFKFLGFDLDQYLKGFDSLEDIFNFIASSRHFNPDIYLLKNLNNTSRVRDRKRKTYNAFLKWCDDNKDTLHHDEGLTKQEYLESALLEFPEFKMRYEETQKKYLRSLEVKKFWNGRNVSEWTGLEGVTLGHFMAHFKNSLNAVVDGHFDQWVLTPNSEEYSIETVKSAAKRWSEERG